MVSSTWRLLLSLEKMPVPAQVSWVLWLRALSLSGYLLSVGSPRPSGRSWSRSVFHISHYFGWIPTPCRARPPQAALRAGTGRSLFQSHLIHQQVPEPRGEVSGEPFTTPGKTTFPCLQTAIASCLGLVSEIWKVEEKVIDAHIPPSPLVSWGPLEQGQDGAR
jgi:hypothetical protein